MVAADIARLEMRLNAPLKAVTNGCSQLGSVVDITFANSTDAEHLPEERASVGIISQDEKRNAGFAKR